MGRPFIVLGDQTDHGGVVIEASVMTDTHGKGIARVGDQVTCPKRNHGTTVIVTGDPTMILDGKAAARHGDKCACGATLISSQFVSTVGDGGGGSQSAAAAQQARAAAAGVFAQYTDSHGDEIIEQFYSLLDDEGNPVEGYRYDLYENGSVKMRSGDFSTGHTSTVPGDTNIDIVFWLNKSGTTKS
jgi:uncharacterized Zn-binding protein involved in type VI secretion